MSLYDAQGVVLNGGMVMEYTGSSHVVIPEGVTRIKDRVFENATSLISITVPGTLMELDYGVFWQCTSLQSVTLANGVRTVGPQAFMECKALKEIVLPASVTYIDDYAFDRSGITHITIKGNDVTFGKQPFFGCLSLQTARVPFSVRAAFLNALPPVVAKKIQFI